MHGLKVIGTFVLFSSLLNAEQPQAPARVLLDRSYQVTHQTSSPTTTMYVQLPSTTPAPKCITLIDDAITSGEIAGAVHLVVQGDKTVHLHATGTRDIETREAIDADTILRIYSMSKPITSVAAMTLYEQQKFRLRDPVAKYLPEFSESTVWDAEQQKGIRPERPMNIRDVLRHTTGYSYDGQQHQSLRQRYQAAGLLYRPPLEMLPPDMTIEAFAKRLANIPTHHQPGKQFTYGYSTDLLGRLIEVWSGEPLDKFLRRTVFEPLRMHDTSFQVAAGSVDRFASCHTTRDGKLSVVDKAGKSPFVNGFAFLSGGGGLTSTVNDYAKFCRMLVNGGQANGVRILQEDTLNLMFSNQLKQVAGDFQFGLGFEIKEVLVGGRSVREYSWGGYASTGFCVVPELELFQIFARQHIPFQDELTKQVFQAGYRHPDIAPQNE